MENRRSPSGPLTSLTGLISGLDHGNITSGSVLEATASFPGANVGDSVAVSPTAALTAGIAVSYGRVTTTDVVAVALANLTTGAIDPASASYDIACLKNPS